MIKIINNEIRNIKMLENAIQTYPKNLKKKKK